MAATIETKYNEEIQMLQLKLNVVEKELHIAIERAEKAETELLKLKRNFSVQTTQNKYKPSSTSPSIQLLLNNFTNAVDSPLFPSSEMMAPPTLPPPPPPPMPKFNLPPTNLNKCGTSLNDGISTVKLNGRGIPHSQQVQATGRLISIQSFHHQANIFIFFLPLNYYEKRTDSWYIYYVLVYKAIHNVYLYSCGFGVFRGGGLFFLFFAIWSCMWYI